MQNTQRRAVLGIPHQLIGILIAVLWFASYFVGKNNPDTIPAFAWKYQVNYELCYSNEPRLTTFGQ